MKAIVCNYLNEVRSDLKYLGIFQAVNSLLGFVLIGLRLFEVIHHDWLTVTCPFYGVICMYMSMRFAGLLMILVNELRIKALVSIRLFLLRRKSPVYCINLEPESYEKSTMRA